MNVFKKRGFTLIELLVSIGILSIVLPSFFVFLNNSVFKVKFTSNITDAFFVTQQKLEELLDKGFNDSSLRDTNTANNSNLLFRLNANQMKNNFSSYAAANFDHYSINRVNNQLYYIVWNVANMSGTYLSTIKQVVVITFWISEGKGHQVSVKTFIRDNS